MEKTSPAIWRSAAIRRLWLPTMRNWRCLGKCGEARPKAGKAPYFLASGPALVGPSCSEGELCVARMAVQGPLAGSTSTGASRPTPLMAIPNGTPLEALWMEWQNNSIPPAHPTSSLAEREEVTRQVSLCYTSSAGYWERHVPARSASLTPKYSSSPGDYPMLLISYQRICTGHCERWDRQV